VKKEEKGHAFAEIVESSLSSYVAQSWQWDVMPEYGTLVHVDNSSEILIGIVTDITTGSSDPTRYPFPYKKTPEELKAEQPQLFEFLRTTFNVTTVGYVQPPSKIVYRLPPRPGKIHSFVSHCPADLSTRFLSNPTFLHLLFAFSNTISNLDELLLAIVSQLSDQRVLSDVMLKDFIDTFSLLSGNDYRRLKLFLSRTQQAL